MPPLRIGVNCFPLKSHIGGMKYYFLRLFDELLAADQENHYVFFYAEANLEELGKLKSGRWRENAVLLPDENHVSRHLAGITLYFCPLFILWPRPLPRPTVVTIPDIQEVFFPEFFSVTERSIRAHHYPESLRLADQVVTISDFSRSTFRETFGIPTDKITVAYPCPDDRFFNLSLAVRPAGVDFPAQEFFLYPANNWPHKNHEALLQALVQLKQERGLIVPFVFTGTSLPDAPSLAEKIAAYGLADQCRFLGYVTVEEMAGLYGAAKGLVFPSLFEGFGIPLVEAMAAGCPVLSSDAASLPEIGGDAVVYFSPESPETIGEALAAFWLDDLRRHSLIARGRERARLFSASRFARSHLEAFAAAERKFRKTRFLKQALRYSGAGRRTAALLSRYIIKAFGGYAID